LKNELAFLGKAISDQRNSVEKKPDVQLWLTQCQTKEKELKMEENIL
jgi:hypothetical protein